MKNWHKSSSLVESFHFAIRGIVVANIREQHVRIHMLIGTLVVCALLLLRADTRDIVVVIFAIVLVLSLEMINTCFELLADVVHPEYSVAIRDAKDILAGTVLFSSIVACIIGLLVFFSTMQTYIP